MRKNNFDTALGISWRAWAILHALHAKAEVLENEDKWISCYAMYNGRERGICLEVHMGMGDKMLWRQDHMLLISFGEHRRSDEIFVQKEESSDTIQNRGPSMDYFSEYSYENREYFRDVEAASEYIFELIQEYSAREDGG